MPCDALDTKEALVYKIARRWIAGRDLQSGMDAARVAASNGFGVILNFLGEDISDRERAAKEVEEYVRLQRAIQTATIDGCVSVKLTQFGLTVDEPFVLESLDHVSANAQSLNQVLWIDMESTKFTEKTIQIYLQLIEDRPRTGIALQAYLRRSEADLRRIIEKGGTVRLVKGAYNEPADLAFKSSKEIRANFQRLLGILFESGIYFAVATHDSVLIDEARRLADKHNARFEFAMLKGIRDELKLELAKSGYRVVEYIPYGDQWYEYSIRRLREHPSNIWLLARSLF
jgi:proline dehydrogenase